MNYDHQEIKKVNLSNHFKKSIRGYDIDEVDSYINKLIKINRNLEYEIKNLKDSISGYSKKDDLINSALIRAEEISINLKSEAETQAKSIIDDAEIKAYNIIKDAKNKADEYLNKVNNSFYGYEKELKGVINTFYSISRRTFQDLERSLVSEVESTLQRLNSGFKDSDDIINSIEDISYLSYNDEPTEKEIDNKSKEINLDLYENDSSMLIGKVINQDIKDNDGYIIIKRNTLITPQLIKYIISKGLYSQLVSSIDMSN